MKQTSLLIYLKSIIVKIVSFFIKRNWLHLSPLVWSDIHHTYIESLDLKPKNTVKKIAFFIHDTISLDHMYNIMEAMPKESFDIILANFKSSFTFKGLLHILYLKHEDQKDLFWNKKKVIDQIEYLKSQTRCGVYRINDIYGEKKYALAVCAHNGLENSCHIYKQGQILEYGLNRFAYRNAYCQFTIDLQFAQSYERNRHFDLIFYSGKWNQSQCKSSDFNNTLKTFCVGVPRLEKFIKNQKKEDYTEQKTIFWLPTHTKMSSLKYFLPLMNSIGKKYKVILKPHPHCFLEIKNLLKKIQLNTNIVIDDESSSEELLALADYVFCDYGGSVFTAIYCDKNVLLLNCPHYNTISKLGAFKSPEFLLRSEIINFNVGEEDKILAALENETIWEKQKPLRATIKEQFFTVDEEPASKKIVKILMQESQKEIL